MGVSKTNKYTGCDVFIALWCIFQLRGIIYPNGTINGIVHYAILFQCIFIAFHYVLSFNKSPLFLKVVLTLLLMYVVYGVEFYLSGRVYFFHTMEEVGKNSYLLKSLDSLLPIFLFYHYSRIGVLTKDRILLYFKAILIISIITFLNINFTSSSFSFDQIESTNNNAYSFVYLIPFLFLIRRGGERYVIVAIIVLFVLGGIKRGAVLIGVLSLLYFILHDNNLFKNNNSKIINWLIGFFFVIVVFLLVDTMLSSNAYFAERFGDTMEGDMSGRDQIALNIWHSIWNNSSIEEIIRGHGANYSIFLSGNFAHNDWMETFCDNGLIGIVLLLFFFIQAFILTRRVKSIQSIHQMAMLLLFITFSKTLFSMSIQNLHVTQCMLFGYLCYLQQQFSSSTQMKR